MSATHTGNPKRRQERPKPVQGGAMTDLTNEDPAVLDAALTRLLDAHGKATDAGDGEEQAIAHYGIMAIVSEMRRRTEAWIAGKAQID